MMSQHSAPIPGRRIALSIATLLCLCAGFLGAIFSLFATGIAGLITVTVGLVLTARRRPGSTAIILLGAALLAGAGAYVLLGILQPDGPGSGNG